EVHADDCSQALAGSKLAPLPQVVSGSAARMRPINSAFIRQQLKANPQLQTLWSRGLTWGFSHLTFDGDKVTVRIVETPRDSSGTTQGTFEHTFTRRTATSSPGASRTRARTFAVKHAGRASPVATVDFPVPSQQNVRSDIARLAQRALRHRRRAQVRSGIRRAGACCRRRTFGRGTCLPPRRTRHALSPGRPAAAVVPQRAKPVRRRQGHPRWRACDLSMVRYACRSPGSA